MHCCGGQCDAELQSVSELPGVSAALERLTSSASVAGAPIQHEVVRVLVCGTVEAAVQYTRPRQDADHWARGRQPGLEAGLEPGHEPNCRLPSPGQLRRRAAMCQDIPAGLLVFAVVADHFCVSVAMLAACERGVASNVLLTKFSKWRRCAQRLCPCLGGPRCLRQGKAPG